ncbi:hypothetical protein K456DRAFT_59392, partial [Colletotrichum gloeosporioides 23]
MLFVWHANAGHSAHSAMENTRNGSEVVGTVITCRQCTCDSLPTDFSSCGAGNEDYLLPCFSSV